MGMSRRSRMGRRMISGIDFIFDRLIGWRGWFDCIGADSILCFRVFSTFNPWSWWAAMLLVGPCLKVFHFAKGAVGVDGALCG
jgi:hypothetical protein